MLSSPRRPSNTILIFSSEEYCAPLSSILRIDCRAVVRPLDVFDDLLARAFACSSSMSHRPLLDGYDEPETLPYQIS